MHRCHGGTNQQWILDNSNQELRSYADQSKCVDKHLGNMDAYMHPCHKGSNQQWFFRNPQAERGIVFGETREYRCLDGYTVGGEPGADKKVVTECLASGEFSQPPLDMQCRNVNDCEENTCGPGKCIDEIGKPPAYTCECNHGYDLRKSHNGHMFCGNTDDCVGMDCGVGVCKDLIGDYTCNCPAGYYIGIPEEGELKGKKTCIPVPCLHEGKETTPVVQDGKQNGDQDGNQ